jgi:antitoxin component of RelBE/YafQ-DinJ toxin-antitoxin module
MTSAFNMFIKAVLRTREFPFRITDVNDTKIIMSQAKDALKSMQIQSASNGVSNMTLDEINAEIAAARQGD